MTDRAPDGFIIKFTPERGRIVWRGTVTLSSGEQVKLEVGYPAGQETELRYQVWTLHNAAKEPNGADILKPWRADRHAAANRPISKP